MWYTNNLDSGRLMHRLILAVDIEKYSTRETREQVRVQTDIQLILQTAARNAGLDQRGWYEQASGGGELVVLPEDVDVPAVVDGFTSALESVLGEFNRGVTANRRLRLRVAMHHGTLTPGPFGPSGDAPIVVSRLLDAKPLRRLLNENHDRDLGLIVSQSLYDDVIRTGFSALDPAEFLPVRVNAKGVQYHGFVQVLGPVESSSPGLLESSSLGTPAAHHIRSMANPDAVAEIVARVGGDHADDEDGSPFAGNADDGRRFSEWLVEASS